jgi:hypothetical protein
MPKQSTWTEIPSPEEFKIATHKRWTSRDPTLVYIEDLLRVYHEQTTGFDKVYVLTDLFFAVDRWLKLCQQKIRWGDKVDRDREPAVYRLFIVVVERLCGSFHPPITLNVLARKLEECFGREMVAHGYEVDSQPGLVEYLPRDQARKYLLSFKDGLAYQHAWWRDVSDDPTGLVPADSRKVGWSHGEARVRAGQGTGRGPAAHGQGGVGRFRHEHEPRYLHGPPQGLL